MVVAGNLNIRTIAGQLLPCAPPLRTPEDRSALIEGVRSGIVDAVATDHAPHAVHEKEVPWEHAPTGVLGLEWAAAVVNTHAGLDQVAFFDRMSRAPARIARLDEHGNAVVRGAIADLAVFDPSEEWIPDRTASKASNSPYLGRPLKGRVRLTMHRGSITARDGAPLQ